MIPLLVLFFSLLVFRGLGVLGVPLFLTWHGATLWALSVMLLFTASAHFTSLKEDLLKMVPKPFPYPRQIVFVTGLLEILAHGLCNELSSSKDTRIKSSSPRHQNAGCEEH
jgi:hypothetical protein